MKTLIALSIVLGVSGCTVLQESRHYPNNPPPRPYLPNGAVATDFAEGLYNDGGVREGSIVKIAIKYESTWNHTSQFSDSKSGDVKSSGSLIFPAWDINGSGAVTAKSNTNSTSSTMYKERLSGWVEEIRGNNARIVADTMLTIDGGLRRVVFSGWYPLTQIRSGTVNSDDGANVLLNIER